MVRPSQILPEVQSHGHAEIPAPGEWQCTAPVAILSNVLRLTAPNPGVMTGPGTNSYLVGEAATGFIVIDPGPADADHLQRLWAACVHLDGSGGNIRLIACTHSHPDHSPGAAPLQALCAHRPPVVGLPSAATARAHSSFVPDRALEHGETLQLSMHDLGSQPPKNIAHTLQVVHTPGHAANHICFLLQEDGLLLTGDHILNGSTTVIDPPDGNMADYIDALDLLHALCVQHQVRYLLPAHGHVISGALDAIAHLKAHRLKREAKIAAVMQANPDGSPDQWLPLAYDDVDARLWPVAKRSLLAHVERILLLQARAAEAATAAALDGTSPQAPA